MQRFALRYQRIIGFAVYLVKEPQAAAANLADLGADRQDILVICRRFVAAVGFCNDHQGPGLILHLFVGKAFSMAQVAAAYLESDKVICVMHNTHLVGLGIADPDLGFMPAFHKW